MHHSKVIQFLKKLTPQELKKLDRYIHSPYFQIPPRVHQLFDLLAKHHPDFDHKSLAKNRLFQKLYPEEPYKADKLYSLNKMLLRAVMDFMVDLRIRENGITYHLQALQVLRERGLDQYMNTNLKDAHQSFKKYPYKDGDFFYHNFRLFEIDTQWTLQQNNRAVEAGLQTTLESLDHFFVTEKLRFACAIINRKKILKENTEITFLDDVLAYCEKANLESSPTLEMYFQTYRMLTEEMEDAERPYRRLRILLPTMHKKIPHEELVNMYSFVLNYCIGRYKMGNIEFLRDMLDIYKILLDKGLLFIMGLPINLILKNLVTVALKLEEYKWTERTILKMRDKLPEAYQEGTISYNLANLYFAKGEYDVSLKHLRTVAFIDPFYRIAYDMLLMKNYYECEELESLLSRCHAFYTYLKRNKTLAERNREAYMNMAKFIRKLARAKFEGKSHPDKLQTELDQYALLVERDWFKRKIEELRELRGVKS